VQIEVKAILQGGAVDFCDEAARTRQLSAVEADAFAEQTQFIGRLARMLAATATDVDSEFA
jgi:hypothetical protein